MQVPSPTLPPLTPIRRHTVDDSETVNFTQAPAMTVLKSVTSSGPYAVGETITYDILVTNSGNVTLDNVTVTDPNATIGACTPVQGSSLVPAASMSCPATYVVSQADLDAGSFTNTATADSDQTAPVDDSETVTFTQAPAMTVLKSVTSSGPYAVGGTITYDILVTNSGNVTLDNVTVTDPNATIGACYTCPGLFPGPGCYHDLPGYLCGHPGRPRRGFLHQHCHR